MSTGGKMKININKGFKQKHNRWFISFGFGETSSPDFEYGFKSKDDFEIWMSIVQYDKQRLLDWRAGYIFKFRDSPDEYRLCDRKGNLATMT